MASDQLKASQEVKAGMIQMYIGTVSRTLLKASGLTADELKSYDAIVATLDSINTDKVIPLFERLNFRMRLWTPSEPIDGYVLCIKFYSTF